MIINLSSRKILRLKRARGSSIEALDGTLWVTEAGFAEDACVAPGSRYSVRGDGLVLVGADASGATALQRGATFALRARVQAVLEAFVSGIRARRTERELGELSDRMLADIGLRRDDIPALRRRVSAL